MASSRKLVEVIGEDIKDHEVVIFDFAETTYLDDSAAIVVERLMHVAAEKHTEVIVAGVPDAIADTLRTLDILQQVPEERLAQNIDEARQVAYNLLEA